MESKKLPLWLGLHPVGDDDQAQARGQYNDHLGNGGIVRVGEDVPDESLVDFQLI